MRSFLLLAQLALGVVAQSKTLIDPSLFPKLIRYAEIGWSSIYGDRCKNPPDGVIFVGAVNSSLNGAATLYRDPAYSQFVLAFPGSITGLNYASDLSAKLVPYVNPNCPGGCYVHEGFYATWNSAQSGIEQLVTNARKGAYANYPLFIVGGSLGGAIASFAFIDFKNMNVPVNQFLTAGQPRVGNQQFANYIDSLAGTANAQTGIYYRFTHNKDPIPLLPPGGVLSPGGYVHSQNEYWLVNGTNNSPPTASTSYRCYGQEPSDCINSVGANNVQPIDHTTYPGYNDSAATNCGLSS